MRKKNVLITIFLLFLLILLTAFFKSAPPSPIYFLKITRETFQSLFIFGEEDTANWYLTLAEKRISEAEFLKTKQVSYLVAIQISKAQEYQVKSAVLLDYLKDKTNITYLEDKYTQNSDRLKALN